MFFTKPDPRFAGELDDKEKLDLEEITRTDSAITTMLETLLEKQAETNARRTTWWDGLIENHKIAYNKETELLTLEKDGSILIKKK